MATLISVTLADDSKESCDARCYNAHTKQCKCLCGGMNHGVGEEVAIANTRQYHQAWLAAYRLEHPDIVNVDIPCLLATDTRTTRSIARYVNNQYRQRGDHETHVINLYSALRLSTRSKKKGAKVYMWIVELSDGAVLVEPDFPAIKKHFTSGDTLAVQLAMPVS